MYSGKLIARAVELYRDGVKPGLIRWSDLHSTLRAEFASELKNVEYELPNPETVMAWVKKYPNLSQRLKDLRVQQAAPGQRVQQMPVYPPVYQPYMAPPVPSSGTPGWNINVLFGQMMAIIIMACLFSFARALTSDV
jgi:hypothetical protein